MSIHKTEALVLARYDVRETSLIVNFFTRDFGKVTGILKGIRGDPAKFASPVDLFSYNDIIYYKKRNSPVHLVSQCDLKDGFSGIRRDYSKIGMATLMMEILNSVMAEEDKNDEVFNLALSALSELAVTNFPEKVTTIFKIKILSLSGFKPHLDSCVICKEKISGQSKFSLNLGGLLCLKCSGRDSAARAIFRGTIATIMHIEKNDFKSNLNLGMNPQIKKELGLVLNSFLNFHLEKEFKSQKVLDKLDYLASVA
ncbi:MAG: DNA repair protein RecO [Candidatus Omnitrophica bacterium]|nr:DNA repair protein RecO [Candidatus Omnitrophota bacterium]